MATRLGRVANIMPSPRSQITPHQPRPRVLFLSFDLSYLNPTRGLLKQVLERACNLTVFGPGYCSPEDVAAGPQAFADRHGPFDMVVADEYALLRDAVPDDKKHLHRFYYQACRFDPLLIHEGTRYYAFLKSFRGPRVISLLASDYYNFTPDFIDQLEEVGDFYLTWGPELMFRKSEIPAQAVAGQPQNAAIYNRWTDRYYDFVTRHADRLISTPHFISEQEFYDRPLRDRRFDWSVLGADYEARVLARRLIDEAGHRRSGRALPYVFAAAGKVGFHLYNKYWAIALLNSLFQRSIRAARYGFTCGSALRWPIRKYFEIPANGAVLVAERCAGFAALGFRDRLNAVAAEGRDVLDAHAWLASDPARAQTIADAGRSLVETRHSVAARAEQLVDSLSRIQAGSFAGSHWSDGDLHFREPLRAMAAAQAGTG
jgi:hypothetical protein